MGKDTGIQASFRTVRIDSVDLDSLRNPLGDCTIKVGMHQIIGTRRNQQDTLACIENDGKILAVVCDGMGGLRGGEVASQTAVKLLVDDFKCLESNIPIQEFLREEAVRMDAAVADLTDETGELLDAGTTVVAVIVDGNKAYWLSVGDSRIYLMRNEQIMQITRDHNYRLLLNERLKTGQISQAEYHAEEDQAESLISYLGIGDASLLRDTNEFSLTEDDIVILCSDGLYKRLPEREIGRKVYEDAPQIDRAARHLTDVVMKLTKRKQGNQDNTSIILLQYNKY